MAASTPWNRLPIRQYTERIFDGAANGGGRPRRVLEQIKGISEQKATKILAEGGSLITCSLQMLADSDQSFKTCPHGFYYGHRNAPAAKRIDLNHDGLKTT